tara:strand:+ start:6245 stop:6745 length:501 start_codon:yes stop_codon:yes gene_type:complete
MSKPKYTATQRAEKCVLDLEAAIYQAAMKPRGTLGGICETFGLNYNTTALQVNPKRTSHTCSPVLIEQLLSGTQSPLIMDAICCAHGNAGWFLLPDADDESEIMTDIGELGRKSADALATMLQAYADQIIEPDEFKAMEKVAAALMSQVQMIMKSAKANMERNNDR